MPFRAANRSNEATDHGKPWSARHVKRYMQKILKKHKVRIV
jgi:hypothetical protein